MPPRNRLDRASGIGGGSPVWDMMSNWLSGGIRQGKDAYIKPSTNKAISGSKPAQLQPTMIDRNFLNPYSAINPAPLQSFKNSSVVAKSQPQGPTTQQVANVMADRKLARRAEDFQASQRNPIHSAFTGMNFGSFGADDDYGINY